MPQRIVQFEGKSFQFPDDATDDEISEALARIADQSRQGRPQPPENKISAPEPGIGPGINRLLERVKTGLGIGKPEGGSAPAFLGGMATGPLHIAHGITDLPSHPMRGANEMVSGTGQALALPLAVAAPAALPTALPYIAGGQAVQHGAQALGVDPDTSEFLGNAAAFGAGGMKSALDKDVVGKGVRGTGELLKKVGGADIPTDIPMAGRTTNMLLKAMDMMKGGVSDVGRKMANYGIPDVTDQIHTGEGTEHGPLPGEPDLPTPVRADGAEHFNDVTDRGESNRLMDEIMGRTEDRLPGRATQDPVRPDESEHHDDINPRYAAVDGTTTKLATINPVKSDFKGLMTQIPPSPDGPIPLPESSLTKPQSFSADDVPTPNSDTLLRAIRSAPGWPENGLPNQPWDTIHANDELPHALDTDPYNRPSDSMIQDPSYTGPERRGTPRGPGYAETSAASDPEGDGDAMTQARSELPSGSLSDHLQRAAEIAAQKRQRIGGQPQFKNSDNPGPKMRDDGSFEGEPDRLPGESIGAYNQRLQKFFNDTQD